MLLSIDAASVLLQCNPETLRRRIRIGEVKVHKVAGVQKVDSKDLALPPRIVKELEQEWRDALERAATVELTR